MIGNKQIQRAATAARNIAVQDKHKRTYLKRDESLDVYKTQTKPKTTSQKILGWVGNFAKMVVGYGTYNINAQARDAFNRVQTNQQWVKDNPPTTFKGTKKEKNLSNASIPEKVARKITNYLAPNHVFSIDINKRKGR